MNLKNDILKELLNDNLNDDIKRMSVANVLITSLEEVAADLLSGRTAQVYRIRQRRCYYLEHRCRTGRHRRQRSLH